MLNKYGSARFLWDISKEIPGKVKLNMLKLRLNKIFLSYLDTHLTEVFEDERVFYYKLTRSLLITTTIVEIHFNSQLNHRYWEWKSASTAIFTNVW